MNVKKFNQVIKAILIVILVIFIDALLYTFITDPATEKTFLKMLCQIGVILVMQNWLNNVNKELEDLR
jgi:hypothetical protein